MTITLTTKGHTIPGAGRLARKNGWVIAASALLAVVVLIAIFGPLLAPYDPYALFVGKALQGPSPAHLLGTDDVGRDILSRLLVGARATLIGSVSIALLSTVVGTALALLAAWFGGIVDAVIARVIEVIFVIPGIVLAIMAVAMFGKGLVAPILALAIAYVPMIARLIRTTAKSELSKLYVQAMWVQGLGSVSILARHVLPALLPTLLAQVTITFGYATLDLAAISYLGLGQQLPATDWGLMISNGQSAILSGSPWESLFASIAVVSTVLAVNVIGARTSEWAEASDK